MLVKSTTVATLVALAGASPLQERQTAVSRLNRGKVEFPLIRILG